MSLYKFNSNQVNKYAGYSRFYLKKRGFRGVCRNSSQSVDEIRNQQISHSLIAIAKADQSLEVGYAYSPYGQTQKVGVENQQIGSENNSQYTGRENDQNGLYYYRARYYDPMLKRFISEDPIGLAGGINSHAYVGGNPISMTDPRGLDGIDITDANWVPDGEFQSTNPLTGTLTPSPEAVCIAKCMVKKTVTSGGLAALGYGVLELGVRTGYISPLAMVGLLSVYKQYGKYYSTGKMALTLQQCASQCNDQQCKK